MSRSKSLILCTPSVSFSSGYKESTAFSWEFAALRFFSVRAQCNLTNFSWMPLKWKADWKNSLLPECRSNFDTVAGNCRDISLSLIAFSRKRTILAEAFSFGDALIAPSRNIGYEPGLMYNGGERCDRYPIPVDHPGIEPSIRKVVKEKKLRKRRALTLSSESHHLSWYYTHSGLHGRSQHLCTCHILQHTRGSSTSWSDSRWHHPI